MTRLLGGELLEASPARATSLDYSAEWLRQRVRMSAERQRRESNPALAGRVGETAVTVRRRFDWSRDLLEALET
ncbi:hypothetical protein [Haladaptatus cibarius]|uniref:hypothetical protein n=1 Tax=Haladaptatus cibarius TaxID=453847 RepID=UPI001186619A|nr:hypothetical protein [Haladaptatus cibarius]